MLMKVSIMRLILLEKTRRKLGGFSGFDEGGGRRPPLLPVQIDCVKKA